MIKEMVGLEDMHKSNHFFLYRIDKGKGKLCRKRAVCADFGVVPLFLIECRHNKQREEKERC